MRIAYNAKNDVAYITLLHSRKGVTKVTAYKEFAHGIVDYDDVGQAVGIEINAFAKSLNKGSIDIPAELLK